MLDATKPYEVEVLIKAGLPKARVAEIAEAEAVGARPARPRPSRSHS